MPNFSIRPTSAVESPPWDDPPVGERASRLNPSSVAPHRHFVVPAHVYVQISATPDGGVEGALDAALSSNFFTAWLIEAPGSPGAWPIVSFTAAHSSVQKFKPHLPGHYALAMRRALGGTVIIHFDVKP